MNKGLALLELKSRFQDPLMGEASDEDLLDMVAFLNKVDLEDLTSENILDKYIEYLENLLGLPHG